MKFLVLYRSEAAMGGMSTADMFANTPPEQLEAGMTVWRAWYDRCGSAIIDPGAPLHNSTTVTGTDRQSSPSSITGYTVIDAASMDDAVALVRDHPHFFMTGATIEILESVPMPGM